MFECLSLGAELRLRDKVVDVADARNGSRILDVATGTGKQAFAFARKGYDVVGIDLSEDMLKRAKKKNKHGNVKFENADATNLPFKDKSFDVSCVSFALHDMILAIRGKALKELVRVTKTEGVIIIVDYALPQNKIRKFLIYNIVRLYEPYYREFITSHLEALLRKSGIEIKKELPVVFGAGRILKGIRINDERCGTNCPGNVTKSLSQEPALHEDLQRRRNSFCNRHPLHSEAAS